MAGGLIGALRATLGLNTADFEAGAARASGRARTMAAEIRGSLDSIKESAVEAGRLLGVALGAELFVEQAKSALEFAGSLGETAQRVGVTVEQLQALQRQASATGTSSEGMNRAIEFFNRTLGQAQAGVPRAIAAFHALGFTDAQIHGFHNGIDALGQTFDRLNGFRTAAQSAGVGARLFGRGYAEIIPMVHEGSAGLEEWIQRARESGEITAEQARVAHEAEVELGQLAITLRTDLAAALVDIIPDIERVVGALQTMGSAAVWALNQIRTAMPELSNVISTGGGAANRIGRDLTFGPLGLMADFGPWAAHVFGRNVLGIDWGSEPTAHRTPQPPGAGVDPDLSGRHGGGRGRGGGGRGSEEAAKRALRDQHTFDSDLRREQIRQLDEAKNQTNDYVEQSVIQRQIMALNREQYKSDLDLKVALHDMTAAQEAQLLQAYDQSDEARKITLAMSVHADWVREQATNAENEYNLARQGLQREQDAAQTAEERRRIGLELLDLDYQYRRLKLQNIVHEKQVYDLATRLDAQQQLDGMNAAYRADRAGVISSTRGPLAQYLAGLPDTAAKAREALQGVVVNGLQGVTDGLAALITGTQKWGDVFKNVTTQILADLIKIELEQRVVGLIGNAINGLLGVRGPSGVSVVNGAFDTALAGIGHRAAGGPVLPGGTYLVGERGPELLHMGAGAGSITPNHAMGGVVVNQNFSIDGSNAASREDLFRLAAMVKPMAKEAFRDLARRQG